MVKIHRHRRGGIEKGEADDKVLGNERLLRFMERLWKKAGEIRPVEEAY